MGAVHGVFVYGTLRPGSWNHDSWLAPLLARPCRPARVEGIALHHHGGLPAVVPTAGASVVGDVADLAVDRYHDGLALLDVLEGTADGDYVRQTVTTVDGEVVWLWLAGRRLSAVLGDHTLVPHGDWLEVPA